jgi:hypothetical protein
MPTATPKTTFTWSINTLERELADGYVFTAHYSVNAVSSTLDPAGNPYSQGAYGSVGLERPEGDLIPFDELTEDQVIGWVKEKLGGDEKVAEIEAALQQRINDAITPKTINGVPW